MLMVTKLQACPKGWIYWSRSCYYKSNQAECHGSAVAFCQKFNATLVNINSKEENEFVYKTFVSNPTYRRTYIGVVRKDSNNSIFVTSEGKPQRYLNWESGQPNNLDTQEDCVEMRQKKWNDINCGYMLPYVCESKLTCETTNPCKNGGRCVDLPDESIAAYQCICQNSFSGTHCEQRRKVCDKGWIAFGNHCYRLLPGARPWTVAGMVCRTAGGDLPVVQLEEENAFLRQTFSNINLWLGITECLCGKKCSVDFDKVIYSNWGTCEPKDLDEAKGCAMLEEGTGKWKNRDCGEKHNVVCKREPSRQIAVA